MGEKFSTGTFINISLNSDHFLKTETLPIWLYEQVVNCLLMCLLPQLFPSFHVRSKAEHFVRDMGTYNRFVEIKLVEDFLQCTFLSLLLEGDFSGGLQYLGVVT